MDFPHMTRRAMIGGLATGAVALATGAIGQVVIDAHNLKPGEFTWHPENAPRGGVAIIVSLPEQRVHVYRNGIRIAVSTCSSGKKGHEYSTLYIAGDTIWNDHVQTAIDRHQPDAIVLNIGNAVFMGYDPIIMGLEDAVAVHRAAPNAMLIASHMEAINHCILSRQTLHDYAKANGFAESLLIPADGETVSV